jgi:hypothetical protein
LKSELHCFLEFWLERCPCDHFYPYLQPTPTRPPGDARNRLEQPPFCPVSRRSVSTP